MTPALKSKIARGYSPVNRIAKPATIVSTPPPATGTPHEDVGITSTHFTSQSQGLSGCSTRPSSRTG